MKVLSFVDRVSEKNVPAGQFCTRNYAIKTNSAYLQTFCSLSSTPNEREVNVLIFSEVFISTVKVSFSLDNR